MGNLSKRLKASTVVESDDGDCGCGCEGAGDCGETPTHRYVFSSERKRTEWLEMRLAQLTEGSKQDREVEELVGKKIRAAVAGLQHEITAMQERLIDYNDAWKNRDFKFFVDAGVIPKQLFADFEKAQSKY